jgi:hypothetical protein
MARAKRRQRRFGQAVRYDATNAEYILKLGLSYLNLRNKPAVLLPHQILKTLSAEHARQLYRAIYS